MPGPDARGGDGADAASHGEDPSSSHFPEIAQSSSAPLCSLAGPRAERQGIYGTDLGYTVASLEQSDRLWILFGDTWAEAGDACKLGAGETDDLVAQLPARLPQAIASASPTDRHAACPDVLHYTPSDPDDPRSWPRLRLFADQAARQRGDAPLPTATLRTPVAAFRDASSVYAIIHRNTPTLCDSQDACPTGMRCSGELSDVQLGLCGRPPGAQEGSARTLCRSDDDCSFSACETMSMCVSLAPFTLHAPEGSAVPPWYHDDPRRGVALTMYLARMVDGERGDFVVAQRFTTNRFTNVAARTVAHFDPDHPERNDYRPGNDTLLLWGRPAFIATGGSQSLPFLLYQKLPSSKDEPLRWEPQFFAGYRPDGRPRWTPDEHEAQPIYGTEAQLSPEDPARITWENPEFDYVNQMGISWVPELQRWVMLYGGDAPDLMVALFSEDGEAGPPVHHQPEPGAIHLRHAAHPWGGRRPEAAWTPPKPILTRAQAAPYMVCPDGEELAASMPGCLEEGDPHSPLDLLVTLGDLATDVAPLTLTELTAQCLGNEVALAMQIGASGNSIGRLYAPNIIDSWTRRVDDDAGTVELYWNVSTWNPYQVILVRSRLSRATPLQSR